MGRVNLEIPTADNLKDCELQSIETLISDLNVLGIRVSLIASSSGTCITFEYDLENQKRNAGRKRKEVPSGSILQNMNEMEIDSWLLRQPIQEICKELKVSRTTAFRRRAEARERLSYYVVPLEKEE